MTEMGSEVVPREAVGQEEFLDAIQNSRGDLELIREQVGLAPATVKKRIREDPVLAQAYEEEYGLRLDLAEDRLLQAVNDGQAWAIKFMLSTKGAVRGYGYKQEIIGGDRVIVLNWSEATISAMDEPEIIDVDASDRLTAPADHPD